MSAPLESPEFGDLYVGDAHDDDGQIIDNLVKEVDAPAEPVMERIVTAPLKPFERSARLLTGTQIFDVNVVSPQMIVPADFNRLHLRLEGYSYAATPGLNDYLLFADDQGKLSGSSAWRFRHTKVVTLDDYTGALWVLPASGIATNSFELTWVATTK